MLRQAIAKRIGDRTCWIQAEASKLPLADASFDWVVCANSFHYFRKPLECLREFHRCLIPNGKLVLVDWCDDYLMCKLCSIWLKLTDPAFFHIYKLGDCRDLIQEAGLDVIHSERFKVGWLWGMMMSVCGKTASRGT